MGNPYVAVAMRQAGKLEPSFERAVELFSKSRSWSFRESMRMAEEEARKREVAERQSIDEDRTLGRY